MRKWVCSALVASLGLCLVSGAELAHADRGYYNAAECLSVFPAGWGSEALVWRGSFGLQYFETSSDSVFCPVRIDASGNVNPTGARVRVYEDSTADDISCTPYFIDDGITFTLPTRYTCTADQSNGCTTASVGGGQDGYLTWSDADFPSGNLSGELSAGFLCNFGAVSGGSGFMQITSYEVTY